jgi:ABC-type dipeptide/oligopeptide/nickel transport system ATPase subunit
MALLEVKGITKCFKKNKEIITAVKNVGFDIEQGECLGLVGESGCGKSTIAGIVSRLIKEDSGNIYFDGVQVNGGFRLKPLGKSLQMIFQNPQDSFDPRDTVLKGIMQGAESYKIWSREVLEGKAFELFDYVGLKRSYAKEKVSELSGGECQRAAIARALICEPKLLICDEATSSLDVLVQAQIVNLLKRLKNDKKMSILFITHDIPLAAALCDRIVVMYKGEVVEVGDSRTVLKKPVHDQTKKLIDSVLAITM